VPTIGWLYAVMAWKSLAERKENEFIAFLLYLMSVNGGNVENVNRMNMNLVGEVAELKSCFTS